MSSKTILTCPTCGSTYHRLGHLLRHAKRKHHIDLSNYDGPHTFDILTSQTNHIETSDSALNINIKEQINPMKIEDINSSDKSSQQQSKLNQKIRIKENEFSIYLAEAISETCATTDCPYCDYKTTDIELFKSHIIAHIRDKNYRCLLCNRLYKYRGKIKNNSFFFVYYFIFFIGKQR
jgi:hypothetical protein